MHRPWRMGRQRADARIDRGNMPASRSTGLRLLCLAADAERGGVTWRLSAPRRETVLRRTFFHGPGPRRPSEKDKLHAIGEVRNPAGTDRPCFQGEVDEWVFHIGLQTIQVFGVNTSRSKNQEISIISCIIGEQISQVES
jgi:hypothetical protein